MKSNKMTVIGLVAALYVSNTAAAQQIVSDWDAGFGTCSAGVWTDACWGCEPMPNNGNIGSTCGGLMGDTYVAVISDGNAFVTMNINITLDGLVINGGVALNSVTVPNNRILTIVGGPAGGGTTGFITLNDRLLMQPTTNSSEIHAVAGPDGSTLRILGSGEIQMRDSLQNLIRGVTGTETIFFGPGVTVGGTGQIGANLATLINEGTILADQTSRLQIDPNASGMTNSGLMVARDGAVLRFQAGAYDNALGEIRAEATSIVHFTLGSQITGGLIVAQSGGALYFNGGTLESAQVRIDAGGEGRFLNGPMNTVVNLTNHGVINWVNNSYLHTEGQLTNTGSFFMTVTTNSAELILNGDTVLDGGGVINMSESIQNEIYGLSGVETFTNVDNTIRGSGNIGLNMTTIINQGTIIADQNIELRIDPNAGGTTNSGTIGTENGALLRLQAGPFTNSGFVFATVGSTISRAATDYIQTAGSTNIDGALTLIAGGTVTLDGGILGGGGQINAHVNNVAGTVSPGNSAGTLTVAGDYTQGIAGSLAVEIGGTGAGQFDVLSITGDAMLAGGLDVTFIGGFDPMVGQTFTILTATNVFGVFDTVTSCAGLSVTYNPGNVILTITSACPLCLADTNGDSMVNVTDLLTLLGAWGPNPGHVADINADGNVNVTDLLILLGAWGACP